MLGVLGRSFVGVYGLKFRVVLCVCVCVGLLWACDCALFVFGMSWGRPCVLMWVFEGD